MTIKKIDALTYEETTTSVRRGTLRDLLDELRTLTNMEEQVNSELLRVQAQIKTLQAKIKEIESLGISTPKEGLS